jgi:hypothetical protein
MPKAALNSETKYCILDTPTSVDLQHGLDRVFFFVSPALRMHVATNEFESVI